MLRHTTFAIVSLCLCGVASAQQPLTPYWNYGGSSVNPGLNCANGFCATGTCATGNCANGQCATGNCPNGNCSAGNMICGPNGCYVPNSTTPYRQPVSQPASWSRLWPFSTWNQNYHTAPAYTSPSSTYHGFPNLPSAYRDRNQPSGSGYPLYRAPMTGQYNSAPGVLY